MKKNDEFEINITDIGTDGEGIGKYDGMTFFIKGGLPGDRILAGATKLKKTYGYARLVKVIKQGQKEGSVVDGNAVYLSDLYWGIVYLNSLKLLYMENHKLVTKDTLNRLLLKDK